VGAKEVMEYGGEVLTIPLVPNYSTTGIIQKLKN
jgi:bifunctional ADP-heptose synthase (sugar kinase/adenylyltransferase)